MPKKSDGLLKHGTILLIATIVSGIANYFFHFYMIRALGPEDYGILFSLLAILVIVGVPAGSIQTVITKYISGFKAKNQYGKIASLFFRSLKKLFLYGSLGLLIFVLASGHISAFLKIPSRIPVIIVGFILLVSFVGPVSMGALQGLQRFTFLGLNTILGSLLRIVFGIFLVWLGFRVNGALAASFLAGLITFFIAFLPLHFLFKKEQIDSEIETGEIYKFFLPTTLALASFAFLTYIDVPLVKHFFSPLKAGYYSTAAIVGKAFLFPPMALAMAMFPKVSELHTQNESSRLLLKKTLILSTLLLLFGILICLFLPKFILIVLMKKEDLTPLAFSTILPLLRVFGIVMSPFALINILIFYNLARHKTRFLYFLLSGTLLQVILLTIFHTSLPQVILILGFSGFLILTTLLFLTYSRN
jgi:O-antigen/teichoic acid export membrane protein